MADQPTRTASDIYLEVGRPGLKQFSGFIFEEWLKDLQGSKAIKVYKEMRDNDPVVGAVLYALKMLIRQASWRVEKAGDTRQDEEAAQFLESCLDDMSMSWQDVLGEILTMLEFGWSYLEIVYKKRMGDSRDPAQKSKHNDGRIGWRKMPIRAQETLYRWEFDEEDGGIRAMVQQPPPDYKFRTIPIEKALLFRTEAHKGNPQGRSILRNAYRPWYFKKHIEEIEGIGIERDLAGLPVAQVPPEILSLNATPEQKALRQYIELLVKNIRRDQQEGIVFPAEETADGRKTGYKLSLLSTGGRRQFDTTAVVQRYDQRIAMTCMADFLLLGHEKVGSFALSSNKTALFGLAAGTILDAIQDVFNSFAIPRLFALNNFPGITGLPRLVHGDIESPDLKELGAYIQALSGAGMPLFPDDQLENYLREAAGIPEKPVEKRLYRMAKRAMDMERFNDAKMFAWWLSKVRQHLEEIEEGR